ncbi:hypothetical protein ONS95_014777 [Cadophora gregata]|uniref:uncharacterized protein n=1 Tax=Cadophora gregata TaxID=51156 RepID=UPI0026DD9EC2|nr:uncharacterized protein ONS95_014777 [Cadophora gregata]KAK0113071.1 hypothetical protein ONS95_014777 [Cadophora gregata]
MSYEDIEEARAKRTAKDATKGKGKRGRKRKLTALEPSEPDVEAEPETAHAVKEFVGKMRRGRKRKIMVQIANDTEAEPEPEPEVAPVMEAPTPVRAPVARMI